MQRLCYRPGQDLRMSTQRHDEKKLGYDVNNDHERAAYPRKCVRPYISATRREIQAGTSVNFGERFQFCDETAQSSLADALSPTQAWWQSE